MDHTPYTLTPRQTQVAQLLLKGLSDKQIARQLGITRSTVIAHTSNIYEKTGATNRAQAAAILTRHQIDDRHSGLLTSDPPLWLTLIHQNAARLQATETTTSCAHAALDMASLLADILAGLTHRIEALEREAKD